MFKNVYNVYERKQMKGEDKMAKKDNAAIDYKTIERNLKLIIAEMGISQHEFCKKIGLTSSASIAKRFKGKGWKLEEMAEVARITGKSVDNIFFNRLFTNVNSD
jgi:DNA-binding XRE family transcriptional regulator